MNFPKVYAFFIQRKQDRDPWPAIFGDLELAKKALGRCSIIVEVAISEAGYDGNYLPETDPRMMDTQLANDLMEVFLRMKTRQDSYHLDYGDAMLMQDMTKLVGRVLDGHYKAPTV